MESCDLANRACVPCRGGVPPLPAAEVERLLADLGPNGWRAVDVHHLEKEYPFPDFVSALAFVNRVGELDVYKRQLFALSMSEKGGCRISER